MQSLTIKRTFHTSGSRGLDQSFRWRTHSSKALYLWRLLPCFMGEELREELGEAGGKKWGQEVGRYNHLYRSGRVLPGGS